MKLLTLNEVALSLSVTQKTLRLWDKIGTLKAVRTKGGHRRYKEADVLAMMGEKIPVNGNADIVVVSVKIGNIELTISQFELLQKQSLIIKLSCEELIKRYIQEGLDNF